MQGRKETAWRSMERTECVESYNSLHHTARKHNFVPNKTKYKVTPVLGKPVSE